MFYCSLGTCLESEPTSFSSLFRLYVYNNRTHCLDTLLIHTVCTICVIILFIIAHLKHFFRQVCTIITIDSSSARMYAATGSVLPRPFLQGEAPCPFLVTPCLFCVKKAGHHFIIMLMVMIKWRPHNPGPRQSSDALKLFTHRTFYSYMFIIFFYGGKRYTTYSYLVLCTELLPNYSIATFTYVNS